ncbi:hypothetical protein HDR63_00670 [bacterium]|nr:hypothetical protein [bacterium]
MITDEGFLEGATPGLWVGNGVDPSDLAGAAAIASARGIGGISAPASAMGTLWPWVERSPIVLQARIPAQRVGDAAATITAAFKHGASSAQILLPAKKFGSFVDELCPIRDDLFFNKELILGLALNDMDPLSWADVFDGVRRVRADGLLLDATGDMPDFVGRIFGMLDAWDDAFDGALQIWADHDGARMEQAVRLIQKMRPRVLGRTCVFMSPATISDI